MKTILTISLLVLFASCGKDGANVVSPIPASLQTGTWMHQDNANTTTELVFNANNTVTVTTTTPPSAAVVTTLALTPYSSDAFLAADATKLRVWRYKDFSTNAINFCIQPDNVGDAVTCKYFTR